MSMFVVNKWDQTKMYTENANDFLSPSFLMILFPRGSWNW